MLEYQVGGINLAVVVLVYVAVGDGVAVGIVYLLEYAEGVCGQAYFMYFDGAGILGCGVAFGIEGEVLVFFGATGQLGNLVFVPSDIESGAPSEVLGDDGLGAYGEFDTEVAQRADVAGHGVGGGHTGGYGHVSQQIVGVTQVPVQRGGEAVVEPCHIYTDVPGGGGFPLHLGIVGVGVQRIDPFAVVVGIVSSGVGDGVYGGVVVVSAHSLLTGLTPAEAQLHLVHLVAKSFEEAHIGDLPAQSQRGEQTPAAVFGEARGGIVTQCECQQVGVLEGVVETSVEGQKVELVAIVIGLAIVQTEALADVLLGVGIDVHIPHTYGRHVVEGVTQGGDFGVVAFVVIKTLPGVTGHHVKRGLDAFYFFLVVGIELEHGVACQLVLIVVLAGAVVVVGLPGLRAVGQCVVACATLHDVVTEVEVQSQFGEEVQCVVDHQVAGGGPHFVLLVDAVKHRYGVVVTVGLETTVVVDQRGVSAQVAQSAVAHSAIVAVYGQCGVVDKCRVDGAGVGFVVYYVAAFGVKGNFQLAVEEFGSEVETYGGALHTRGLQDTVVVCIGDVEAVGKPASCAADAQVVVMREGCTQNFALPVGGGVAHQIDGILGGVLVDQFAEFVAGGHVPSTACRIEVEVGAEVDLGLAAFAFLGGDDDHTVGCTATIDGCCGGVLEDGEALDVVGGNHGQGAQRTVGVVHGHSVDNDQRIVGGVERSTAADADVGTGAGVTAVGCNYHTGACTYQQVVGVGGKSGLNFIGLDYGHTTGGVLFLHCTVTYYHEVLENFGVGGEVNGDVGAAVQGHFLCLATYVGHYEGSIGSGDNAEIAVYIGGSALGLSFDGDGSAHCGLVVSVIDGTGHRHVLCQSREGHHQCHYNDEPCLPIHLKTNVLHATIFEWFDFIKINYCIVSQ